MERTFERTVAPKSAGMRLDQYLVASGIGLTRSQVGQLIKEGKVLVNDQKSKPGYKVKPGDRIFAKFEIQEKLEIVAQDIPVPILYEDEDIVVVNKPVGMVVHPAKGNLKDTLINALLARYPDLPTTSDKIRPGIVHRLDKETSGVLVVAKTDRAVRSLARQISERTAKRIYWAIVWGSLEKSSGVIEAPIGRHPIDRKRMAVTAFSSKPAITQYKTIKRYSDVATLLEVSLQTGRTHQIRVHLEFVGHPVVGDPIYGGRDARKIFHVVSSKKREIVKTILQKISRQALHARCIIFKHPKKQTQVEIEAPLPDDMQDVIEYLETLT